MTSFLLFDIRETETTSQLLNEEGAFTRLVDLISSPKQDADAALRRMLMELLYEMSRIQRIKANDLGAFNSPSTTPCRVVQRHAAEILTLLTALVVRVDDAFVCELFKLIEEFSNDVNDPYHYPIIRVLVGSPDNDSLREITNHCIASPERAIYGIRSRTQHCWRNKSTPHQQGNQNPC